MTFTLLALFKDNEPATVVKEENKQPVKDDKLKLKQEKIVKKIKDKQTEKINPNLQPIKPDPKPNVIVVDKGPDNSIKEDPKPNEVLPSPFKLFVKEGKLDVLRNGENIILNAGDALHLNDEVATVYNQVSKIRYDDKTEVSIKENSRFKVSQDEESKIVSIQKGNLFFSVSPQKSPLLIYSGQVETKVVGTSLEVNRLNEIGHVKVITGKVISKIGDQEYTLTAGKMPCLQWVEQGKLTEFDAMHGFVCGEWNEDSKAYLSMDITEFIQPNSVVSVYFSPEDELNIQEIDYVELHHNKKVVSVDNHPSFTAPHDETKRNLGIFEKGPYGANTYRFFITEPMQGTVSLRAKIKGKSKGKVWVSSLPMGNLVKSKIYWKKPS